MAPQECWLVLKVNPAISHVGPTARPVGSAGAYLP
jgi:hypothetical protein